MCGYRDRERAAVRGLRLVVALLVGEDDGQVVQDDPDPRVVGPQLPLPAGRTA